MYLSLPRLSRERTKVTGICGTAGQRILAIGGVIAYRKDGCACGLGALD